MFLEFKEEITRGNIPAPHSARKVYVRDEALPKENIFAS